MSMYRDAFDRLLEEARVASLGGSVRDKDAFGILLAKGRGYTADESVKEAPAGGSAKLGQQPNFAYQRGSQPSKRTIQRARKTQQRLAENAKKLNMKPLTSGFLIRSARSTAASVPSASERD